VKKTGVCLKGMMSIWPGETQKGNGVIIFVPNTSKFFAGTGRLERPAFGSGRQMKPAEIGRIEGVGDPSGIRGMIIRVSDQFGRE
jgi:hypothetical protein